MRSGVGRIGRDEFTRQAIVVGLLFGIFFLCYGYELTNFNLSIDEELFAFHQTPWLGDGRWALQLVTRLLWPEPTTPFGPFVLFGVFGSIGYAVLLPAFHVKSPRAVHFALFPTFIAFPVWFNQVEFSGNVIGDGLAVMACCVAVRMTSKATDRVPGRTLKGLVAVGLVALAVGVYQSFLFLYVVLGIAVAASDTELTWRIYLRRCGVVAGVGAVGFLASLGIGLLSLRVSGVSLSPYARSFLRLDQLVSNPGLVLVSACHEVASIYFLDWIAFGHAGQIFLLACAASTAIVLLAPQRHSRRAILLVSLAAIAVIPFGFTVFAGGVLPVRSYVAVPAVVWCCLLFPHFVSRSSVVERTTLVLALVVATEILFVQSVVQARSWTVQQRDRLLAGAIYDRIAVVRGDGAAGTPVKVVFYGTRPVTSPYPMVPSATSGGSFFDWDGGSSIRVVSYMKFIGFSDLVVASVEDCQRARATFSVMPSWPAPGAVRLDGAVVLVKLSEVQTMGCL